ncbi:hypothetical protein EYZ11_002023 [Aspergillus tanneri]|uniref:Uncharacterized protein n=1 Tax=Aspergillus tanneri TaxID=1220188 RepID=A0A4S3JSA0_9EURO|nr:hypothetical protein EYZ11_002023 [Aspergillus tanneri]
MPLRDILQKKDKLRGTDSQYATETASASVNPVPDITFIRSDTSTHEVVQPPIYDGDQRYPNHLDPPQSGSSSHRRSLNPFRRSRSPPESQGPQPPSSARGERRLSQLLHRDRRRSNSTSANVPADLPQISSDKGSEQDREAQWEKRATMLVQQNRQFTSSPLSPRSTSGFGPDSVGSRSRSSSHSGILDQEGDLNIQEAIRLHEAGDMFRRLAEPSGANNALSQVLYGLALRHGWGCTPDPDKAVTYLSAAASNSALIESQALQAGMKKGGAAKGELVLAMFELGNCFRNGWGVQKDPVAARQYFETAANLGDTDAMNETAWCYLEGFGGKKDKVRARLRPVSRWTKGGLDDIVSGINTCRTCYPLSFR